MTRRNEQVRVLTDKDLRGLVAASGLRSIDRGTLLALADGLDRRKLIITMGIERLADALGLKPRATQHRLRSLESTGAIKLIRKGGGRSETGRGYVNQWRLDLDCLRVCDRGAVERTPNSAVKQHQERNGAPPRVQPAAQDSSLQGNQEKTSTGGDPPASLTGCGPPPDPDGVRPWVNRRANAETCRQDRLQQLRSQLTFYEVWSSRKGGVAR